MSPAKSIIRIIITQVYERSMVVHSQPNRREEALEIFKTQPDMMNFCIPCSHVGRSWSFTEDYCKVFLNICKLKNEPISLWLLVSRKV